MLNCNMGETTVLTRRSIGKKLLAGDSTKLASRSTYNIRQQITPLSWLAHQNAILTAKLQQIKSQNWITGQTAQLTSRSNQNIG